MKGFRVSGPSPPGALAASKKSWESIYIYIYIYTYVYTYMYIWAASLHRVV